MGDGVDFPQHLVGEGRKHPPGAFVFLLLQGKQLFTVKAEGQSPILLLLHPHLHILRFYFHPSGAQRKIPLALPSYQNVPVCQHLFGRVLPEINQREQSRAVAFGAENQLIFFAVIADFKSRGREGRLQCLTEFFHQLFTALPQFVGIHDSPQFCLDFGKSAPCLLGPFAEVCFKAGQGQTAAAVVDVSLRVLVAGTGIECLFKVMQGRSFFVQVIVRRSDSIIPAMVLA